MSRPLRIQFEGAHYHVMNRGDARRPIFQTDDDHSLFLEALKEAAQAHRVVILAYCLMDNHYHLLIKTPLPNLSSFMKYLGGVYTQRHNRINRTDGHLFRGRYKAILVKQDAYLLHVMRYIHLNPVQAGICQAPGLYPHSSHAAYDCPGQPGTSWIDTRPLLAMLLEAHVDYQAFIKDGLDDKTARFYEKKRVRPILGDKAFLKQVEQWVQGSSEVPDAQEVARDRKLNRIRAVFSMEYPETRWEVSSGRGKDQTPRQLLLAALKEEAHMTYPQIQRELGFACSRTASTHYYRIKRRLAIDTHLKRQYRQLLIRCSQEET